MEHSRGGVGAGSYRFGIYLHDFYHVSAAADLIGRMSCVSQLTVMSLGYYTNTLHPALSKRLADEVPGSWTSSCYSKQHVISDSAERYLHVHGVRDGRLDRSSNSRQNKLGSFLCPPANGCHRHG